MSDNIHFINPVGAPDNVATAEEINAAIERLKMFYDGKIKMAIILKGSSTDELAQLKSVRAYLDREIEKLERRVHADQLELAMEQWDGLHHWLSYDVASRKSLCGVTPPYHTFAPSSDKITCATCTQIILEKALPAKPMFAPDGREKDEKAL